MNITTNRFEMSIFPYCAGLLTLFSILIPHLINTIGKIHNPACSYLISDTASWILIITSISLTICSLVIGKLSNDTLLNEKTCRFAIGCNWVSLIFLWVSDLSWIAIELTINNTSSSTFADVLTTYANNEKWQYITLIAFIITLYFFKSKKDNAFQDISNGFSTGITLKVFVLLAPICIVGIPITLNSVIYYISHAQVFTDFDLQFKIILNTLYLTSALIIIIIAIIKTRRGIINQQTLLQIIHISGITCVCTLPIQIVAGFIPYLSYHNISILGKISLATQNIKTSCEGLLINFLLFTILTFLNKAFKKMQFSTTKSLDKTSGNHGTAKWADETYLKQKGLYKANESLIGIDKNDRQLSYPICNRTILANSGGGKSSCCFIPALLTEDRPIFCFDPKGELWAVTAKQRAFGFGRNRKVVTIDPFNLIQKNDLCKNKSRELLRKYKLNPLEYISDDPNVRDRQLTNIAQSCVTRNEKSLSQHWYDYAEIYIKGLIEYILDTEKPEKINLLTVREYLLKNKKEMRSLITALRKHGGKHTGATAAMLSNVCDEEKGSIWSTTYRQFSWASDKNTIDTFTESNIDLRDFIRGDMDIFVILPEDQIQEHSNVIRLIFTSIINIFSQTEPSQLPKAKSLFILDELGQLGASRDVQQAIEILRYKQVIIWAAFQNYGQIKLYQKPESFTEAPLKQFFSTDDVPTMEWIQKLAGFKTIRANSIATNVNTTPNHTNILNSNISTGDNMSIQETGVPLLHLNQIREMSQDAQLIFIKGISPILCNRIFYYKDYTLNSLADPNPYIR